jgi:SM-20-related protein
MFAIAPHHRWEDLAASFREQHRLQIRDFLTDASAREIQTMLEHHTPWGLCFNQGEQVAGLRAADVARLSREKWEQITQVVASGARDGFEFFYQHYPVNADYFDDTRERVALFDLFEFINSEAFLGPMRVITGYEDIVWADAHATCYQAGHFLMRHDDLMAGTERRAAYVLNFTRAWRPDWGGYLQFFDASGDIEKAYRPLFNAINLLRVPQDHSVGAVSPFATGARLSVTGWLRADKPPKPIGRRA